MNPITSEKIKVHKKSRRKGRAKYRLNKAGETVLLSKHFDQLRRINEDYPPFQNIPWDINKDFEAVDYYEIAVMALVVLPQVVYVYPILFILLLPPIGLNLLYILWAVSPNCDRIPRNNVAWKLHVTIQAILCVPAFIVASTSLLVSSLAMTFFGIIYCMWEDNAWCRYQRNLQVIEPYRHGPVLLSYFSDCVAVVAGMVHRRGLLEFTSSFSLMFIVNPWVKYWLTGNIFLSDLGERFVTQIGKEETEVGIKQMRQRVKNYISRAKSPDATRRYISSAFFCPHFQYPPKKERFFAIGLEHSTIAAFVVTTHFQTGNDCLGHSISMSYPTCISPSAEVPVYRVILWRNNPYHIFTGVVEATISKGKHYPEHPMWLISGHNKLAASETVMLSTGWIDTFFEEFIPIISNYIRMKEIRK